MDSRVLNLQGVKVVPLSPVIVSEFFSNSASASPSGFDADLFEQSHYKAASYQSNELSQ
jgi:hypothetical protein